MTSISHLPSETVSWQSYLLEVSEVTQANMCFGESLTGGAVGGGADLKTFKTTQITADSISLPILQVHYQSQEVSGYGIQCLLINKLLWRKK